MWPMSKENNTQFTLHPYVTKLSKWDVRSELEPHHGKYWGPGWWVWNVLCRWRSFRSLEEDRLYCLICKITLPVLRMDWKNNIKEERRPLRSHILNEIKASPVTQRMKRKGETRDISKVKWSYLSDQPSGDNRDLNGENDRDKWSINACEWY